ncbi:hypothetical protein NMG60_11022502 [Bertholletia excelsa]
MADPTGAAEPNRIFRGNEKRLRYAFDGGFLSGDHPADSPEAVDGGSETRRSPDSESSDSDGESRGLADLAASFRVFSESVVRMELAELEMVKAREASRQEAENRRAELDSELTQMLLQTQLHIASYVAAASSTRKRKRSDGHGDSESDSTMPDREGATLLSLLHCNLI